MPLDTTVFETDTANVCLDMPATLVYASVSVIGCKGEQVSSHDLELAGYNAEADLEWMGVVSDFTGGVPGPGQEVTVDSVAYKVERVQTSPCGKAVNLFLAED